MEKIRSAPISLLSLMGTLFIYSCSLMAHTPEPFPVLRADADHKTFPKKAPCPPASGFSLDSDTEAFLDKLDSLTPPPEKDQESKDKKSQAKETPRRKLGASHYGRKSSEKIRGKISSGTIEHPGAALGGNSSYR